MKTVKRHWLLASLALMMLLVTTMWLPAKDRIVFAFNGSNYKDGFDEIARQYMELNPDIEVEIIYITLNYETWVRTQFAGGENLAPDIYNGNVTNTYGRLGKWVELNDYLDNESPYTGKPWGESFDSNLLEKLKETGKYYHVCLDFVEIGIFYNKDLFEKYGYQVPQTWDEMMALGEQIKSDGLVPIAVPGILREVWSGQVGWMARMLGDVYYRDLVPVTMSQPGDWDFEKDRNGNFAQDFADPYDDMLVTLSQERTHQAILDGVIDFRDERSRQIYKRIKQWSQYWQPGYLGSDSSIAHRLFLTQKSVMELHHSANVTFMMQEMKDLSPEEKFEWGVFGIPDITNDPLAKGTTRGMAGAGTVLTVTKKSDPEHEKRVVDFLMYLTRPESAQLIIDLALENDRPVIGPSAIKDVRLDPELMALYEPFTGRGFEKLNFRGLDDEQESVYEWSVRLQDYLGDRIDLDTFLNDYQSIMMRAHERIAKRNGLDMDPKTNDVARLKKQLAAEAMAGTDVSLLNGSVVVLCLYGCFGLLMGGFYFRNQKGLARRRALIAYIFLIPTFFFVITFLYYPALSGLLSGFTEWEEGMNQRFNGLNNFTMMAHDPFLITSIWNQVILLVTGIIKATLVPLGIAELVVYLKCAKLQYLFRTAFLVPMVVPAMVVLLIWGYVYDPQLGMLNNLFDVIGESDWKHAWLGETKTALASIVFLGFPWIGAFGFLIYLAGLMNVPRSVMDAAKLDCRHILQRIWYVDMPLLRGQTRLLVILTMIGSLQDFQTVLILTEGGPGTSTIVPALRMFHAAFRFNHFGYGAAIGFMLFLVILILTLLNYKYFKVEELW